LKVSLTEIMATVTVKTRNYMTLFKTKYELCLKLNSMALLNLSLSNGTLPSKGMDGYLSWITANTQVHCNIINCHHLYLLDDCLCGAWQYQHPLPWMPLHLLPTTFIIFGKSSFHCPSLIYPRSA
jgi:hypothetical protein